LYSNNVRAAAGFLPANGQTLHTLPLPAAAALDGATLFFQAFSADGGSYRGVTVSDGKPLTLHKDQNQPIIALLTVNRIPADQNGSEEREGTLHVPRTGFSIDLFVDPRGQGALDPQSLEISADQPLNNGAITPGTNLKGFFTATATSYHATVDATWMFPDNVKVTLKAKVKNQNGAVSPEVTYAFQSRALIASERPFVTKQLWHVEFDVNDGDNSGVPDSREDLLLYGLSTDAKATSGPSFQVSQWTRQAVVDQLRQNYGVGSSDAVDIDFSLTRPPGTFSTLCIGGRNTFPASLLPPGAKETTGEALYDHRNQDKQEYLCNGFLGVHPRSIWHLFKDVPAFQTTFAPLMQNPVGNDPDDPVVTAIGFDPGTGTARQRFRYQQILRGVAAYANATAFVGTQKTCHSMGQVAPGPLPAGLLGGPLWGHSTSGHFDDGRGNYLSGNNSTPAPAQPPNLALIWDHFQSGRGHFTPLNWAYLRERIIN
jgi:hypothetical protein